MISIPLRVKRSPTDLLKALSKTVDLSPLASPYALIDDSNLAKVSPLDKKKHLLSKASGIKAARLMIETYPEAFMKDECVPHVPSFFPKKAFSEAELKYPSEELIYSLIIWGKFLQAYDTYLKCKDQDIPVSDACIMILMDLLCIHNSNDLKDQEPVYEEWYNRAGVIESQYRRLKMNESNWNSSGAAIQLFNILPSKTASAYCSLIKGAAKYKSHEVASVMYDEMKSNKLVPDLSTINCIISLLKNTPSRSDEKTIELLIHKLQEIKEYGIKPNLKTFNNVLDVLSGCSPNRKNLSFALDVLKEMKDLNIKPSLGTFAYILEIFYPKRDLGMNTKILEQVLEEVERESNSEIGLQWQDETDSRFFEVAMKKCKNGVNDPNIVKRLHSILMKNNNVKFLTDNFTYNSYFETYIEVLTIVDVPENVIAEWRNLTPHIFNRSAKSFIFLSEYILDYKLYNFLPEFWQDLTDYRLRNLRDDFVMKIVSELLQTMVIYNENTELTKTFGDIAASMIKSIPFHSERPTPINDEEVKIPKAYNWDSATLSDFFIVVSKANMTKVAAEEFNRLVKNPSSIAGELNSESLNKLFRLFIGVNDINKALNVTEYASQTSSNLMRNFLNELNRIKDTLSNENQERIKKFKSNIR